MSRLARILSLCVAGVLVLSPLQGACEPPSKDTIFIAPEGIRAADEATRVKADQDLTASRKALFEDLRDIFGADKGRAYNGPRHLAVRQMGVWRFDEAIPLLVADIAWTLDKSTFPGGAKWAPWAYYPAATALRDIGGWNARAAIIKAIQETDDDTKLRLSAWILSSTDGPAVARMHLAASLEGVTAEAIRARLEKAKEYVAQGDAVFAGM